MLDETPGTNDGGQLGYGDRNPRGTGVETDEVGMGDALAAVDLGTNQKAITVAAGFFHTCALLYVGDVKCWGKMPLFSWGAMLLLG